MQRQDNKALRRFRAIRIAFVVFNLVCSVALILFFAVRLFG